jgi:hypothetical protein
MALETRGGSYFIHQRHLLHGEDISTHFPRDKFVLGLHNGGEIFGLAEHLVRQALKNNNLEEIKRIVSEHNVELKNLNLQDNILKSYLRTVQKDAIDNDIVIWLIENGGPFPSDTTIEIKYGLPTPMLDAASKCDERVLRLFVEKGLSFSGAPFKTILQRGVSYDTLKICWKSFLPNSEKEGSLIQDFLQNLDGKKFKTVTFKNRALIMTAWKFDKNCLFRQVPKEIMMEILSHDGIDEPPYWDFLEFVIEHYGALDRQGQLAHFSYGELRIVIPLVWKNWDLPTYSFKTSVMKALYSTDYSTASPNIAADLNYWALKFLQRLPNPPSYDSAGLPKLAKHCLLTPNNTSIAIIQLLITKNVITPNTFLYKSSVAEGTVNVPAVFAHTVLGENKPMIKFLVETFFGLGILLPTITAINFSKGIPKSYT